MKKIFTLVIVTTLAFGCKNSVENNSADSNKKDAVAGQNISSPEAQPIDTLAVFNLINGKLKALSGQQLWSKDIFTSEYYEASERLEEFSDGDALWCLGSIQEVRSVELTDISEFKMQDSEHAIAEAILQCYDYVSETDMEGSEFRTLCLILKDNVWLIDDVGYSKEHKLQAIKEYEETYK